MLHSAFVALSKRFLLNEKIQFGRSIEQFGCSVEQFGRSVAIELGAAPEYSGSRVLRRSSTRALQQGASVYLSSSLILTSSAELFGRSAEHLAERPHSAAERPHSAAERPHRWL